MDLQIISCTNRPGNRSIHIARYYQEELGRRNVKTALYNLEDLPLRLLETDLYGKRSEAFLPIQAMIDQAKRFLFVVPEYNRSVPGVFKLLIDACDFPGSFQGKEGWSVGLGAGRAGNEVGLQHLRDIMDYLGTDIHPEQLTISQVTGKIDAEGNITDDGTLRQLESHVAAIEAAIRLQKIEK